jgi:magnesium chelatase subunit I
LVSLLPDIPMVAGDKYNSPPDDPALMSDEAREQFFAGEKFEVVHRRTPFVELPLGATEDRVTGTIDIERALKEAGKAFEPGILARVNRGILYIDECNLLDDQLVDVLLDSAAGGWNTVEREGVSVRHPARFILVGTSHPDEGDLRPQLLDRFGLTCSIRTPMSKEWRLQVVTQSFEWQSNPEKVEAQYAPKDAALKQLIVDARARLKSVVMPRELSLKISKICSKLNIDGLRGDIVTNRTARALAALEGRNEATAEDIRRVAVLCLQHRLRKDVVSDTIDNAGRVVEALIAEFEDGPPPTRPILDLLKPVNA